MRSESGQHEIPPDFFVTGGTMPSDAPSYLERAADHQLVEALLKGEFCYVLTARQMGKSSLVSHARASLRKAGRRIVLLDLQKIGLKVTLEQWYSGLIDQLGLALKLDDEFDDYIEAHPELPPHYRWSQCVTHIALERVKEHIVIFVDEIDIVRSLEFSASEFFGGIREMHNTRSSDERLKRVTFCLLGVATPSDLIADVRITPFNIGTRIDLRDFNANEVLPLARGFREPIEAERIVRRVQHWTGGQPYLTQKLCSVAAQDHAIQTDADVDRLCHEMFLTRKAREADPNLIFVRDRLLNPPVGLRERLELYRRVWMGYKVPNDEKNAAVSQVALSGALVTTDDGLLQIKSPIYKKVFDRHWIKSHLPVDYREMLKKAALWVLYGLAFISLPAAAFFWKSSNDAVKRERSAIEREQNARVAQKSAEAEREKLKTAREAAESSAVRAKEAFMQLAGGQLDNDNRSMDAFSAALVKAKILGLGNDIAAEYEDQITIPDAAMLPRAAVHFAPATHLSFVGADHDLLVGDDKGNWDLLRMTGWHEQLPVIRHKTAITATILSPDGAWFISADDSGMVYLTETATQRTRSLAAATNFRVNLLAVSPDSKRLLISTSDGTLSICDLAEQRMLRRIPPDGRSLRNVVFNARGDRFATASANDDTVRVLEVTTGAEIARFSHPGDPSEPVFSPDGTFLATLCDDGVTRIWRIPKPASGRDQAAKTKAEANGAPVEWRTGKARLARFSPDGATLLVRTEEDIAAWDVWNRKESGRHFKGQGFVMGQRSFLAVADDMRTLHIFRMNALNRVASLPKSASDYQAIIFSEDDLFFATRTKDGAARIWRMLPVEPFVVAVGEPIQTNAAEDSIRLACGGAHLAVIATGAKVARLFDVQAGRWITGSGNVTRASLSNDSGIAKIKTVLPPRLDGLPWLRLSEQGALEYSPTLQNGGPKIWEPMPFVSEPVQDAAWNTDSEIALLLPGGSLRTMKWEASAWQPAAAANQLPSMMFSDKTVEWDSMVSVPGGTWLLGHVEKVTAISTLEQMKLKEPKTEFAHQLRGFAPDGRALLIPSAETAAQIYGGAKTDVLGLLALEPEMLSKSILLHFDERVMTARLSVAAATPDQRRVALGYQDGSWQVWALHPSRKLEFSFRAADGWSPGVRHADEITSMTFSKDGSVLAIGSLSGVRLWELVPENRRVPSAGWELVAENGLEPLEDTMANVQAMTGLDIRGYQITRPLKVLGKEVLGARLNHLERFEHFELPPLPDPLTGEAWAALLRDTRKLQARTAALDAKDFTSESFDFPRWARAHPANLAAFTRDALAAGSLIPALLPQEKGWVSDEAADSLLDVTREAPVSIRAVLIEQRLRPLITEWPPEQQRAFHYLAAQEIQREWDQRPASQKDDAARQSRAALMLAEMKAALETDETLTAKTKRLTRPEWSPFSSTWPASSKLLDADLRPTQDWSAFSLLDDTPEQITWFMERCSKVADILGAARKLRDAAEKLADQEAKNAKYAVAMRLAVRAESLEPKTRLPIHWQASLCMSQKLWDETERHLLRALALTDLPTFDRAALLADQANVYWLREDGKQDKEKAYDLVSTAATIDNTLLLVLKKQTEYAPRTREGYQTVVKACDNAIALEPKNSIHLTTKARALLALGRRDDALAALKAMRDLAPDTFKSWYETGNFWLSNYKSDADEALCRQAYQEAEKRMGADAVERARLYGRWGEFERARSRYQEAFSFFDKALREKADDEFSISSKAECMRETGFIKEAEKLFDESQRLYPENSWAMMRRARLYEMTGPPPAQNARAEAEYRRAARGQPDAELCGFLDRAGKHQESLAMVREMQRKARASENAASMLSLEARALRAAGDLEGAMQKLREALAQQLDGARVVNPNHGYTSSLQSRLGLLAEADASMALKRAQFPDSPDMFVESAELHCYKATGGWRASANADTAEFDLALLDLGRATLRGLRDWFTLETNPDLLPAFRARKEYQQLISALKSAPESKERRDGLRAFWTTLAALARPLGESGVIIVKELEAAAARNDTALPF